MKKINHKFLQLYLVTLFAIIGVFLLVAHHPLAGGLVLGSAVIFGVFTG